MLSVLSKDKRRQAEQHPAKRFTKRRKVTIKKVDCVPELPSFELSTMDHDPSAEDGSFRGSHVLIGFYNPLGDEEDDYEGQDAMYEAEHWMEEKGLDQLFELDWNWKYHTDQFGFDKHIFTPVQVMVGWDGQLSSLADFQERLVYMYALPLFRSDVPMEKKGPQERLAKIIAWTIGISL